MMSTGNRTTDSGQELVHHHNELSEQTAIAEGLKKMDGELAVLEQRREMTRALKQEIITGRTRFV
jgi:type I restriction enzyme S subunit